MALPWRPDPTEEAAGRSQLLVAWCKARDLEHVTQKRFGGMMGEKFTRDANGYPRYLGVRAKLVTGLRIVARNQVR